NLAAATNLVNRDANCGFESPDVKASAETSGVVGGLGSVKSTVRDCVIDLGTTPMEATSCDGSVERVTGAIRVSGTRTVSGILTGDVNQPVVPISPDAVTFELSSVEFTNFLLELSASDKKLTQVDAKLSATIKVLLAASTRNICEIVTPNAV